MRLLAVYSLLLVCCSLAESNSSGESKNILDLNRHITFQAGSLGHKPWDPKASFSVQTNFSSAVFTKLVYIDSKYNVKTGLFQKWEWDQSKKKFEFTISEKYKFDSGRPVRPEDIEFALVKSFLAEFGEYKRNYFFDIVGVTDLKVGQKFKSGMCEGIRVVGPNKIAVYLNKSNPDFIYTLQDAVPIVAPIEDFKEDYFTFKSIPRGTGKFFVKWSSEKNSSVILQRKKIDNNQNVKVPLSVEFINQGSPAENLPDLAADAGTIGITNTSKYKTIFGSIPYGVRVVGFNYDNELGKNKLFRKAVSLAINRKEMFPDGGPTTVTHELVPSMYLGRSGTMFKYDPGESRQIVQKHFKNSSSPKKRLKAIFHGLPGTEPRLYLKNLQKQLETVGIYVEFHGSERVELDDPSIVFREIGKGATFTDPVSSFSPYVGKKGLRNNLTEEGDKVAEDIFNSAKNQTDKLEKSKLLKKLTELFQNEYRVIPTGEIRNVYTLGEKVMQLRTEEFTSSIDFDEVILR